ncbi:MAG: Holliday junction branch migration protein RuvA [Muribaculaceae bacterium]|nr:Holliday junction branch migration protein RuvA [Muribaculaceae bacterium]
MYEYIKGTIVEISPAYVVLDNNGVGYMLNISLNCYTSLQHEKEAKLFVYEAIREDAHVLFGFVEKRERELFELLITVSGVGPNTARMILSSLTVGDLEQAIGSGNANALKSVKGIGGKTAQRIIVDLKDKINVVGVSFIDKGETRSAVYDEALAALVMLGFTQQMSQKALKKLFAQEPDVSVEDAIKKALKMM